MPTIACQKMRTEVPELGYLFLFVFFTLHYLMLTSCYPYTDTSLTEDR